jgi:hypothetical protein
VDYTLPVKENHRVIKKVLHVMITIQKVTSNVKVSAASLQTFIDTPTARAMETVDSH